MSTNSETIIPAWPDSLEQVDIVKLRFVLDFSSACTLRPADFLGLGRILKTAGRQLLYASDALAVSQWEALFQPPLSPDPVALRKYQKPAPAFVMTMPIDGQKSLDSGEHLDCEVLFIGTGIPLIHVFLRSMIHLGRLGLVDGEGHFEITEVYSVGMEDVLVWRQDDSVNSLRCPVVPMSWLLQESMSTDSVTLKFVTPTRLIVDGKPLRKPKFGQIFPFMLRRVTSIMHAHAAVELQDDIPSLIDRARQVDIIDSRLDWHDWRNLGKHGMAVGGFVGEMVLDSRDLEDIFWVLAVISLFGVGKGATYGAGQVKLLG